MDLNNLEGVSSWINNLTGGAGIEGLGDIGKLTGLLGAKGGGSGLGLGFGRRFPIILILILLVLFGNRGGASNCNYPQQYACYCYKRKHRKHHRRRCCCCGGYGQAGYGCGTSSGQGGFGGSSNIIFIIIILLLIRTRKGDCETSNTDTCDIFNFNADDVRGTEDQDVDFTVANEEE